MFAAAAELCNNAVLGVFGQSVTVTVGTVDTVLTGVYTAPGLGGQSPGNAPFQRPDPRVQFRSAEIASTGAKPGDTITVGGTTYYIADLAPDDAGMTEATLRPK